MNACRFFSLCAPLALVVLFFAPHSAEAATLYLDAPVREVGERDTLLIPLRIDVVPDECINAATVELSYDPARIDIVDVSRGESIFSLWTEEPVIDRAQGLVRFSGGLPGGYCGRIVGDPGETNVLVQLAVMGLPIGAADTGTTTDSETVITFLESSEVLQNDGTGTPLELHTVPLALMIVPGDGTPDSAWLSAIRNDSIAPELFEIALMSHPSIEDGKWVIAFSTTDKQSGIDRYEVLETDPDHFGFLAWSGRKSGWVRADSPYVLLDQELSSKIMVKAVDKAGNERVVHYTPPQSILSHVTDLGFLIVLGGIAAAGVAGAAAYRRFRIRKKNGMSETASSSEDDFNADDTEDERALKGDLYDSDNNPKN